MKFCTHCGSELTDEAVICHKCGCPTNSYNNQNNPAAAQKPANHKPQKERVYSPLSIVGFVFAFLFPLAGLICSIIAFKTAQAENNDRCRKFAKAGIIISAILLGLEVISNVVFGILRECNIEISYYWNYWRFFFDVLF